MNRDNAIRQFFEDAHNGAPVWYVVDDGRLSHFQLEAPQDGKPWVFTGRTETVEQLRREIPQAMPDPNAVREPITVR